MTIASGVEALPPVEVLRRLINGFQVSQAICAAGTLGVSDLLADGPRSAADLAAALEVSADPLYRLMRALATVGVYEEREGRVFALTPTGACLRSDISESLRPWSRQVGSVAIRRVWDVIPEVVRTGQQGFEMVHGVDTWAYRAEHPEDGEVFDAAMTSVSQTASRGVLEVYDFSRFSTVVDVGGGQGALLAAVVGANGQLSGILADQPAVIEPSASIFAAAGLGDRCTAVATDFFEAVPGGGDCYLMKSILHDWDDADATAILRTTRAAVPEDGVLLVVERVIGAPNTGAVAAFSDLMMMVQLGGRERTEPEYDALLAAGGFRRSRTLVTDASSYAVLECVPV